MARTMNYGIGSDVARSRDSSIGEGSKPTMSIMDGGHVLLKHLVC